MERVSCKLGQRDYYETVKVFITSCDSLFGISLCPVKICIHYLSDIGLQAELNKPAFMDDSIGNGAPNDGSKSSKRINPGGEQHHSLLLQVP